ncbi:hypothetical protein SS50377_20665 [Spironucleus salmonicida]|uniref:Uncharacterized protein n=1 Tax=Spironucleus salmonicida TaxID=348837 RepID=V6M7R2_9EUKA|nr:hypothetical protein SS50377_20665 [Spironucleus salmonicida]|eukprot:EST49514.1 Hypothetical protein SS50377_10117 [Spironucleus salmonicida]
MGSGQINLASADEFLLGQDKQIPKDLIKTQSALSVVQNNVPKIQSRQHISESQLLQVGQMFQSIRIYQPFIIPEIDIMKENSLHLSDLLNKSCDL